MPTLITFEYPPDVRSIPFTTPPHPSVECGMEGLHSTRQGLFWPLGSGGAGIEERASGRGRRREARTEDGRAKGRLVGWGGPSPAREKGFERVYVSGMERRTTARKG